MRINDIFREDIKIFYGFDENYNPIIKETFIDWRVIDVCYEGRYFIGENIYKERKCFSLEE